MLERDDWARLDTLLQAALDRPESERAGFLNEACAGDAELRACLAELTKLAADTDARLRPGGGLEGPVFEELARDLTRPAALPPGTELGRFVVRDVLGAGGMGQVYRALDPALQREVAIKAVAWNREDSANQRRFEREARVLATLNHPNVGAIYGLELIDSTPYLVLELVEGETLAERLKRGPLPLPEALSVGVQIAEALEEAHRHGIVHRDLKPANVKLTEAGRVKVLDFGIAKPVGPLADREGETSAADPTTMPGTMLGTAPYMSPEQVRGLAVDTRSDLWAFGCVLFEMLTGRRAFTGTSASDVLAAVLRDEVDLQQLPEGAPAGVRQLLRRCLRKDPRDRLQSAGDARLELTEAAMEEPPGPAPGPSRRRRRGGLVLALLTGAALAGLLAPRACPLASPPAPTALRLSLALPAGVTLSDSYAAPFALSPDGRHLAVVARRGAEPELFVRTLSDLELHPLAETAAGWQPAFSPDGHLLAFFAGRMLKTIPIGGGGPTTLAEVGGNPRGVAWLDGGFLVFAPSQSSGLMRIGAGGGAPTPFTRLDEARGEISHRWPQALPGGRHVLITVAFEDRSYDEASLEVVDVSTGERRPVLAGGAHGRVTGSGQLVFARGGRLLAVPFNRDSLSVRGTPEVMVEGVRYDPQNGGAHVAVSESGTLVYTPGTLTSPERSLAWIDARGSATTLSDAPRVFREPRLHPDGRRLAAVVGTARGSDVFVLETATRTLSQVTFNLGPRRPVWTPDGRSLTLGAPAPQGWRLVSFPWPRGDAATLLEAADRVYPSAWTPDGRRLVYQQRSKETGWDLFVATLRDDGRLGAPTPLAATPFQEANAALSPDGRFVAYESDELDGVFAIYVRALGDSATRIKVSADGARWPRFGLRGRLYFWHTGSAGGMRLLEYRQDGDRFLAGAETEVWAQASAPGGRAAAVRRVQAGLVQRGYDVEPGAERFLMLESPAVPDPPFQEPVVIVGGLPGITRPARPEP